MKRREFVKKSLATSALFGLNGLPYGTLDDDSTQHITVLHTNDVHSHVDPFGPNEGRNANKGGVARRAALLSAIRKENPNTLLLDAGDIFQGTPYFNYYGGELEIKLMSMLKYDACTIGNHDFDNGIEGLYKQLPHANFQFLSANYDFRNTIMEGHVSPYKVFTKNKIKIGVFGLGIELKGLVDPRLYKETHYIDPVEIAQDTSRLLKEEEQCDLIICLSHLGYNYKNYPQKVSDLAIARSSRYIDLIIGGHTHTFLEKPTIEKNLDNHPVIINQVGAYGLYLGRLDFYFRRGKRVSSDAKSILI